MFLLRIFPAFRRRDRRPDKFVGQEQVFEFDFRNKRSEKITIWLEPWAEEIPVNPGSRVKFTIYHIVEGPIYTEQTEEFFVVWLWRGCRADISVDGRKWVGASASLRAPG